MRCAMRCRWGRAHRYTALAALPDAEIETYLHDTQRAAFTPATITATDDLRGETLGAFSVAIPTARFDAGVKRRVSELLTKTCGLLVG